MRDSSSEPKRLKLLLARIPDEFRDYASAALEELARIIVLIITSVILNLALLYTIKSIWSVYIETQVGKHFIAKQSSITDVMQILTEINPLSVSIDITLLYLLYCSIIAAVAQFVYLRQFLFSPQNLGIKIIWVLGATFFLADATQLLFGLENWEVHFYLVYQVL